MEYINRKLRIVRAAILLACFLTLSMIVPVFVFAEQSGNGAANAVSVSYVERSWNAGTQEVVSTEKTRDNVQTVPADGNMTSGWYYLDRNVTKNGRINLTGDVNLILGDGKTLDVKGLYIPSGKTLTIYGQSAGMGRLYSHPDSNGAGIGGKSESDNGNIIIQGGNIEAYGHANCAGIGTNDSRKGGAIKIYGGTIKAQGGKKGAGIGGGKKCDGGTVEIYGGTVYATGGQDSAGIGGGEDKGGGNITIYGGIVNATGSHYAAGIGGGNDDGPGGNITINGGTVTAKGGDDAAGIGGAEDGDGGTITINGGTVNVTAGANAAGIGGGENGDGGTITINGGDVTVKSRDGAAIGGAEDGDGGTTTINGGTLWLDSGNGAGIGGGNKGGDGGRITITGGDFHIHAEHGAGIGGGRAAAAVSAKQSGDGGRIRISGNPTFDITADYGYGIGAGDASDVARQGNGRYIGAGGNVGISGGTFTFRGDHIQACFGGDTADFEMTDGTVIDAVRDTSSNFLIWYLGSADIKISGGTLVGGQIHMHSWGDHSRFEMIGGELRIRNHYHIDNESIRSKEFSLGDNVMVKKGEEENAQKPVKASDREKAARGTNHYVTIVTCDHPDASYRFVNENQHRASCAYCQNRNIPSENHIWKDGKCEKCGYVTGGRTVTFDPNNGADSPYGVSVPRGNPVTQPEDPVKRGFVFVGWYQKTGGTVADNPFDFTTGITENITLQAKWTTQWRQLQDKIDAAAPDEVIVLENDYRADSDDRALVIAANKTVTINLNGHMIDRANPEERIGAENIFNSVFVVDGGTLTVIDSGEDGVITGGTYSGVYMRDNPGIPGVFTLESGSISENNSPDEGGGVYVSEDCRFFMEGGSINGNISNKNGGGVYVANRASFTMSGGDISQTGTIKDPTDPTGGAGTGYGGGVYIASGASFRMEGGSISRNYSYNHGGGVYSAGTSILEGGSIGDNASEKAGGGVYMREGTFAMTGGSIGGNVSRAVGGGGVYASTGTFQLAGGTIRDNICAYGCNGGGVYVAENAFFELSGGPVIDGNRALVSESGYTSNDVYLPNNKKINVSDTLKETAMIGVRVPDASYTGSEKPFTNGLSGKGTAGNFFSDSEEYMVDLNSAGEAYLTEPGKYVTVTFDRNDGSEEEAWSVTIVRGEKVQKPEDPTLEDYVFLGWYLVTESGTAENPYNFNTPVTQDITLKALWEEIEWSEPTYEWSEDYSTVTATSTAMNVTLPKRTETVSTTLKDVIEATCTEKGLRYYTAVFEDSIFREQTKVVEIGALGHSWSEPAYTWAEDNSTVTAQRVCEHDSSHVETEMVTCKVTVNAATCEREGETTYAADFANPAFSVQVKHETIPALGHDWSDWRVTKEPTETEEGAEERSCSRCEETETRAIPVIGHTHKLVGISEKQPTCTEDGNKAYWICAECGRCFADKAGEQEINREETVIPATGHTPGAPVKEKVVEPSCETPGSYEEAIYCTVCKAEIFRIKATEEALGHDWGSWMVTEEATETVPGKEQRECRRCGETETRAIPVIGHEHKLTGIPAKQPTCTEDGNIAYYVCDQGEHPCGRCFADAAGTEEIDRDAVILPAAGHTYGDVVTENVKEPKCETEGSHDLVAYCTVCGDEFWRITVTDQPLGHKPQHIPGEIKEPTCTEAGYYSFKEECEVCHEVVGGEFEYVDALGHDWGDWTVTKEATETEPGEEQRECRRCGEIETREIPVTTHVHRVTKVEAKEATCREPGNIAYYVCDQGEHPCGRLFVEDKEGTDLIYENETEISAREVNQEDVILPVTDHTWNEGEITKEPGCTSEGIRTYTCTVCGATKEEKIDALGHAWGPWTVTKEATVDEEGEETRTCARCGEAETRAIPKIDPGSIEYHSITGDGAIWTKGSHEGLTFTFKRNLGDETTFEHFKGIQVDGSLVPEGLYEAVPGSVVVTLKPEYLESLSVGEHKLAALFEDGNAPEVSFKIAEAKEDDKPDGQPDQDKQKGEEGKGKAVPGTGDENHPVIWASLLLLSALAIGIVTARRTRKNK